MAAFEFSAIDTKGRMHAGLLEGDTPRQIRQQLREKDLTPLSVDMVGEEKVRGSGGYRSAKGRIRSTDLALISRQLATLLQAGTVMEECLRTVAEQAEKKRLKSILLSVRSKILEGYSIDQGLADFPSVFPELYRATLAAGEQAGHLDVVFERLADYTEFRQQLRQRLMLALLYPLLLTGVAVLIIGALLIYVVPQVVDVFTRIDQELPLLTRFLIGTSDFLQEKGLFLLIAGIGLAVLIKGLLRKEAVKRYFHHFLLKLPVIGKLSCSLNAARFARSFSIVTASGVPVLEGLKISSQVINNLAMREALDQATAKVREGSSLHQALAAGGYFPPITIHLIASGEASSNLENMLDRAASTQEREIESLTAVAMGIFEPALILVMGGIVLFIVLAVLLPIFELNQLVQ
ncbi:MAG: type II secretion system inner membrane protein GspF [Desulfobia sp.]